MIIVKIIGGLGNQLFQYALGRSIQINNKCLVKYDVSDFPNYKNRQFLLDKLNVQLEIASSEDLSLFTPSKLTVLIQKYLRINKRGLSNNVYQETERRYDPKVLAFSKNIYLAGHWTTEKYFKNIRDELINELKPVEKLNSDNLCVLEDIYKNNSISIHVRRGDYVSNPAAEKRFALCGIDYYTNAIELMNKKITNPKYFLFSDDVNWVKNNFPNNENFKVVDVNNSMHACSDLYLMSQCDHNITANSTFSWWGAWLNDNEKKIVVVPKRWYKNKKNQQYTKDIIPIEWIQF